MNKENLNQQVSASLASVTPREKQFKRALDIRADSSTGLFTVYSLSEKYGVGFDAIYRILSLSVFPLTTEVDGLGVICLAKNISMTKSGVSRILHQIGFTYTEIAEYMNVVRQYANYLAKRECNSKTRPMVPIKLKSEIEDVFGQNVKKGMIYYIQESTDERAILYPESKLNPRFVTVASIRKARKELIEHLDPIPQKIPA